SPSACPGTGCAAPALPRGRHLRALLVPRQRVRGVVEVSGERGELERAERVAHHGQLLGARGAEGLLDQAWLGTVREPGRVQRDRPDVDALARAELAVDVIDHLLR